MLEACVDIAERPELEIYFISDVHDKGGHIATSIYCVREDEGYTDDHVDVWFVLSKETDEVACAYFSGVDALAAFLKRR